LKGRDISYETMIYKTLHRKLSNMYPTKNCDEVELRCSHRVSSSCSISGTRHVTFVTNLVINREWGN
jgi:hypothetical protein